MVGWKRKKTVAVALTVMTGLLLVFPGFCAASAGGGGGWQDSDTYKVMNFAVLAVALFLLVRKPAGAALDGRIKGIRDELQDLEAQKESARKKLDEYTERLSALEQEAAAIIEDYKAQGEAARTRILEDAQASARKIEQQAQRNIENEFELARQKLQQDIFEKAVIRAEELVKTKITPEDQNKLVDEYLEKVVAK